MEFIAILLSSLMFIGSPIGFGLDTLAEQALRSRLNQVDDIQVRVDNRSNLNLLRGRIDGLQVGLRGLYPVPGLRVAIADLETDPIDLDIGQLRRGKVALEEPLNGAMHVVITPEDINTYLQSPEFTQRLSGVNFNLGNAAQAREASRYQLTNPQATFLDDNRLQIELDLAEPSLGEGLKIRAQSGFAIENGHQLVLIEPEVSVNGSPAPKPLIDAFIANLGERLSLRQFEAAGLTARVLNATVRPEQLDLVMWVSVAPDFSR